MSDFSDRTLARRLIETRERGFTYELFYKRSKKNYALLVLYLLLMVSACAMMQYWPGFWMLIGMLLGCVSRDFSWLRAIGKTWAFTEKVTDWDKVSKLAEDGPSPV